MKIRPLISKVLGPPAVLFLLYVFATVSYQLVFGLVESRKMKRQANAAIEEFHSLTDKGDVGTACQKAWPLKGTDYCAN